MMGHHLAVSWFGAGSALHYTGDYREGAAWKHHNVQDQDAGSMATATGQCQSEWCPIMVSAENSS